MKFKLKVFCLVLNIVVFFMLFGNLVFAASLDTSFNSPGTSVRTCNLSAIRDFKGLLVAITNCFLNPILSLMLAVSVVSFVWGVFKFITVAGEGKEEGKEFMIWGVVGLFVMVTLWGLVNFVKYSFTLNSLLF